MVGILAAWTHDLGGVFTASPPMILSDKQVWGHDTTMEFETIDLTDIPDPGIPSLGGQKIAGVLRSLVAQMPPKSAIIETGAWLGAGTWHLADAAAGLDPTPTVHVYDRFQANKSEAERATTLGVPLEAGADTSHVVRQHLNGTSAPFELHKGDLMRSTWGGGAIGLWVDDAAKKKQIFAHLLKTFGPSFVPGETVLILMDFHYWKKHETSPNVDDYRAQADFMAAHPEAFEHLGDPDIRKTSTAVFRYHAALDFGAAVDAWLEETG